MALLADVADCTLWLGASDIVLNMHILPQLVSATFNIKTPTLCMCLWLFLSLCFCCSVSLYSSFCLSACFPHLFSFLFMRPQFSYSLFLYFSVCPTTFAVVSVVDMSLPPDFVEFWLQNGNVMFACLSPDQNDKINKPDAISCCPYIPYSLLLSSAVTVGQW